MLHHIKQPTHVQLVYSVKTALYSTDVQGINVSPSHVSNRNISLHAIFIDRKHIQQMDIHQRKMPTDTSKRSEKFYRPLIQRLNQVLTYEQGSNDEWKYTNVKEKEKKRKNSIQILMPKILEDKKDFSMCFPITCLSLFGKIHHNYTPGQNTSSSA